ncbi:hypothetical protein ACWGLF_07645 [Streptomyces puniciscabiei]
MTSTPPSSAARRAPTGRTKEMTTPGFGFERSPFDDFDDLIAGSSAAGR